MRRDRLLLLALIGAVWLAYLPVGKAGFIWDDNAHVTRPDLRSLPGLARIWTDPGATQQYYPLLHSVFWVEHRLFGDRAPGYHLVNLALHSLNAVLLWLLLRRLRVPGALFAAGLFALHPVMVESVAWITELKNTLSGAFYLGAALAWLRFDENRSRRAYALALGLFILGLLSKTVIATLPAALLVVFWWRRGTLSWRRDVRPLLPFFALGLAAGLFTAWVERKLLGAEGSDFALTAVERGLVAGRACWFYLGKLLWPSDLLFIYPRWTVSQGTVWQYVFPAGVLLVLAAGWALRHRARGLLAATLFFIGTLFPALGFLNVYPFLFSFVADHFQYLASLGVIVPVAVGAAGLPERWPGAAPAIRGAGLALLALLGVLTWRQSLGYQDNETVFRRVLEKNPACWLAHFNVGNDCLLSWRVPEAIEHFQAVLRLKPDSAGAYNDLAAAFLRANRPADALAAAGQAVRLQPDYAAAHNFLGTALLQLGRDREAAAEYATSLRLQPGDPTVQADLAVALRRLGRRDEAITQYTAALRLAPGDSGLHLGLGAALLEARRAAEARVEFETALQLQPGSLEARNNLGAAWLQLGRIPEAITQYEAALRLDNGSATTHYNLGNALLQAGQRAEAVEHFTTAIRLHPDYPEAHNNLAGALAQSGRLDEAVTHYREALRLQPGDPEMHTNLGAVLLYQGQVEAARRQFTEALRLQPDYVPARENLRRLPSSP